MRQINANGIHLIKSFEGLFLHSYQDSVGVWTLGFGRTSVDGMQIHAGMTCTKEEAETWLLEDVENDAGMWVRKWVKVPLDDNEYAALCSFTYNLGCGTLAHSMLLHSLNGWLFGPKTIIANLFLPYDMAGHKELAGLKRRREAERFLFLSDIPNMEKTINA